MTDLRVLLINDFGPESPRAGGAEVVVRRTLEGLRRRGIETELFSAGDVPGHRRSAVSYISNSTACAALEERLRRFQPRIVHLHNFYHDLSPAILGVLKGWKRGVSGRRIVATAHDFHLVCPSPGLTFFRGSDPIPTSASECLGIGHLLLHRWDRRGRLYGGLKVLQHLFAYRTRDLRPVIDLVLCPSAFMAGQVRMAGLKTEVLSNIAPEGHAAEKSRAPALNLVFAGRLEPEKGLGGFLASVPNDVEWMLEVIGEGEQAEECRRIVAGRGLGERVRWAGRLSHEETLRRIALADVLVLPSVWPENQPLVLLEALAMQTSLLVPDLGGMSEIVRESGVGERYAPGDGAAIRASIVRLAECKRAGTLNSFDVRGYLSERDEKNHFERLLRAYGGAG